MEQNDVKKTGPKMSLIFKTVLPTAIIMVAIIVILSVISTVYFNKAYSEVITYAEYEFDANIKTTVQLVISALTVNHQLYLDGVISEEQEMEIAKSIVRDTRYSSAPDKVDDGYFWADMADGLCIVHYNPANEGAMRWDSRDQEGNLFIQNFIRAGNEGGDYTEFYFGKPGDEGGSHKKRGYTEKFEPYGWYISTGNYYEDMEVTIGAVEAQKLQALLILLGASLIVAVVGVILLLMSLNRIVKPIQTVSDQIHRMSLGEIIESYAAVDRHDEIGELMKSIGRLSAATSAQTEIMQQIAGGDYALSVEVRSDKDAMSQAINDMLVSTNDALRQIHDSVAQVDHGSTQIADGAQALAQGATQQAASVEQLSSSVTEIAEKTKSNAERADQAAKLAGTIKESAEKGSRQMDDMMAAVNEINEASGSISKVIKVIDDIAFQTNILALNAAVEAARAGQHGKGFAVVAEEVRNLAAKSAAAAKDTGAMIENSIEKANLGVRIAGETADSLTDIVSGINESNKLVIEIARSSEEQSAGIKQINTGIEQVAQVVQQNSATAQESAAATEEMSSQSAFLQQLIAQFRLKDDNGRGRLQGRDGGGQRGYLPEHTAPRPAPPPGSGGFGKY